MSLRLLALIVLSIFISIHKTQAYNPNETFTFRACRGHNRDCTFENLVFSVDDFVQHILRRIQQMGLNYDMAVDALYFLEGKYKDINPDPSPPPGARGFEFAHRGGGIITFRKCEVKPGDVITNTRHIMFSTFTYFAGTHPDTPYIHHFPKPPPGVGIIE